MYVWIWNEGTIRQFKDFTGYNGGDKGHAYVNAWIDVLTLQGASVIMDWWYAGNEIGYRYSFSDGTRIWVKEF